MIALQGVNISQANKIDSVDENILRSETNLSQAILDMEKEISANQHDAMAKFVPLFTEQSDNMREQTKKLQVISDRLDQLGKKP